MPGRILTEAQAGALSRELRHEGRVLVFTNGCFDVIHAGHVEILRKARSLGDCLFLGVNTDDSVSRLKGVNRPLNPLEARVEVLSELRSVDYIVPFRQDTPLELIMTLKPDILVKGGDYRAEEVVGGDFVRREGGRVEIVPLLEGYSSSSLLEKLGL